MESGEWRVESGEWSVESGIDDLHIIYAAARMDFSNKSTIIFNCFCLGAWISLVLITKAVCVTDKLSYNFLSTFQLSTFNFPLSKSNFYFFQLNC